MVIHLGLGDQIICNGLVRTWLKEHPLVRTLHIPCRLRDVESVSWMYRDMGDKIKLIEVPNQNPYKTIFEFIAPLWPADQVTDVTCFNTSEFDLEHFDQEFYRIAGIPFEKKWSAFYYSRDRSVELLERTEPVIIHDDPSRSFTMSRKRYPVLKQGFHIGDCNCNNIFQLASILEGAKELHVINSCVFNLMDFLNPRGDQKRLWHFYARPETTIPTLQLNWKKLD